MKKLPITTLLLSLGLSATLSFAGEMGHSMKEQKSSMHQDKQHMQMPQQSQSKKHMMQEDEDEGMMMKKSGNKPSKMACGTGKCAAGKCGGAK